MSARCRCHDAGFHEGDSMKPAERDPRFRGGERETNPAPQQTIDMLIDEIGEQSFPASDPPAWGTVSSRLDQGRGPPSQGERNLRSSDR